MLPLLSWLEATFSEVLEWCLSNVLGLLKHYAGDELQADTKIWSTGLCSRLASRESEDKKGKNKKKGLKEEAGDSYFDPTRLAKWKRVKALQHVALRCEH